MLSFWSAYPERLIGPFVPPDMTYDGPSREDRLFFGSRTWNVLEPRALLFKTSHLDSLRESVDTARQEGWIQDALNCTRSLLNLIVFDKTSEPPMRVRLPPASVIDRSLDCLDEDDFEDAPDPVAEEEPGWCMERVMGRLRVGEISESDVSGVCGAYGHRSGLEEEPDFRWIQSRKRERCVHE